MNFWLYLKQAFSSLLANKLRAILSILGIVIGISSVVIMLGVGEGVKASILQSFDNAENMLTIQKSYGNIGDSNDMGMSQDDLENVITLDIANEIPEHIENIDFIATNTNVNDEIMYNGNIFYNQIIAISEQYGEAKGLEIKLGKTFSSLDFKQNKRVVILGYSAVQSFFGKQNPIGKDIFVGKIAFTVVGIYDDKNFMFNDSIYIPITTAQEYYGAKDLESILVFTKPEANIDSMKRDIGYFLYKKSGATSLELINFTIQTNKDIIKMTQEIMGKLQLFLGAIGSIALFVGGIGIMNIMLVSVTERTREIGIRKAIGATRTNILMQFLVESIILSLLGLIIAIILCYGIATLLGMFVSAEEFSIIISPNIVVLAAIVSISMGIIFGIMPAYKASKLRPVDTLRYE